MDLIWLSVLWFGCGFLGMTRTSSSEDGPRVARFCPPTGLLWPSGLISREEKGTIAGFSPRETAAFKAVVKLAGATLGIGKNRVTSSGWASLDVNRDDPVEVALAARL
jgi:hypothetical protein